MMEVGLILSFRDFCRDNGFMFSQIRSNSLFQNPIQVQIQKTNLPQWWFDADPTRNNFRWFWFDSDL